MTTKFIGVKDFRQNMAKYAKQAKSGKVRYVVMNRTKPLFEITPFAGDEEGVYSDEFLRAIQEGLRDMAEGNTISHEEMLELLDKEA
jgi:antitoxin (DNA-binding transcriptional repressor) of toxin-antitoxin stability system